MGIIKKLKRDSYILKNYVLSTKEKPFLCSFKLTYKCNLRCDQCPFHSMRSKDLSFEEVKGVLDQLYNRGNRIIVFEGGEPMLWKDNQYDTHDVVREAKKKFFSIGMTTNGTLSLDVAVDVLWVSIDGLKDTHNYLRNGNVFDKVMDNIKSSSHPKLFAHITVNSKNYSEIPDLIKSFPKNIKGVTIQFYYPYNKKDELFLDFDKREKLLEEIISLKDQGWPILNSYPGLEAMKRNKWTCIDWLVDNANPDGNIIHGCYLKGRTDKDCSKCGFSPHVEISLAYKGNLKAIKSGVGIFFEKSETFKKIFILEY